MTPVTIHGAPEGFDALLLARRRAEHKGAVLHVARDDTRMARLHEALTFFAPELEIIRFPAWDCLPYDRVSPNPAIVSERIATLARLIEPSATPRIVLTTVNALVQRVPPRTVFRGASPHRRNRRLRRPGRPHPLLGSQRVRPGGHGDGAGRIRRPRRHRRHLSGRRARPGPPGHVRRYRREHAVFRRLHPAQHHTARPPRFAPRLRNRPRPRQHQPLP